MSSFNAANYVVAATDHKAFWADHNNAVNCSYAAINDPSSLLPGSTTFTTSEYYPGGWNPVDGSSSQPWVINPQPIVWPPTTVVSPGDLIETLQQREGDDNPETLEETIEAVQDQALYDVQNGNITEEQFFEVMKMTFAMLKLLPKKEKEEPADDDEEEDR